jgi:hypothetical protein
MDPKDKTETLSGIVRMRLEKYQNTRDLQFKVNIALWTLIVLAGYKGDQTLSLYSLTDYIFYGVTAVAITAGHYFFWLRPMSASMARDNVSALELQKQIENIIGERSDKPERSPEQIKHSYGTMNLFLSGITLVLLILLGIFLAI